MSECSLNSFAPMELNLQLTERVIDVHLFFSSGENLYLTLWKDNYDNVVNM